MSAVLLFSLSSCTDTGDSEAFAEVEQAEPGPQVVLSTTAVAAGGEVEFEVLSDAEIGIGDEYLFECWTGSGWTVTWQVDRVFANPTVRFPQPGVEFEATLDEFLESKVVMPVPETAVPLIACFWPGPSHH